MSAHPYQIYAPGLMDVKAGPAGTFAVVNTGTKAIKVTESLGRYSTPAIRFPAANHATMTEMSGPWLTVWPHVFTLAPHQAQTVHIKATVPAGAAGDHYLSVVWSMRPLHASPGAVQASGAVATLVRVPLDGTATPVTNATAPPRPHAAAGHAAGAAGFPTLALGGILLAMLALVAAGAVLRNRYRARRTRGYTA